MLGLAAFHRCTADVLEPQRELVDRRPYPHSNELEGARPRRGRNRRPQPQGYAPQQHNIDEVHQVA
jgi:hypothetical protein